VDNVDEIPVENEEINLQRLIETHIQSLPYNDGLKEKLNKASLQVYNKILQKISRGNTE
jgi:hypothetical protein